VHHGHAAGEPARGPAGDVDALGALADVRGDVAVALVLHHLEVDAERGRGDAGERGGRACAVLVVEGGEPRLERRERPPYGVGAREHGQCREERERERARLRRRDAVRLRERRGRGVEPLVALRERRPGGERLREVGDEPPRLAARDDRVDAVDRREEAGLGEGRSRRRIARGERVDDHARGSLPPSKLVTNVRNL
jgi:hypothetical protein